MTDLPGGTVTLLFSDVEASTEVMKRLGDGWPDVLDRHRVLLRGAVEAVDGVVVDCQGDAMFAAFRSAHAGVDAAVNGQANLAREDWPPGGAVRVRMALHTGEPHRTGDGYTGIDVVHVARLCAAGHGGQVLLTAAARVVSRAETTDLGQVTLPDLDEPETVYQLVAPGLSPSFPPLRTGVGSPLDAIEQPEERIRRAEDVRRTHQCEGRGDHRRGPGGAVRQVEPQGQEELGRACPRFRAGADGDERSHERDRVAL